MKGLIESIRKKSRTDKALIIILLALVFTLIVVLYMPFGKYEYKKKQFHIVGMEYFLGKTVAGGSVAINPQSYFSIAFIVLALCLASLILFIKNKHRISGMLAMLAGTLEVAIGIIFNYKFNEVMSKLKKTEVLLGSYAAILTGILLLATGFTILYFCKVVNMLDIMIIPGLAYLIINNYIPMSGIIIAFKKLDYSMGVFSSPWNGIENFKFLAKNSDIGGIIRNTVCYNVAFIILNNLFGIAVGIMLNEAISKKLQRVSQTVILLPQIISWVIVAYMTYGLLSTSTGWINNTLLPLFGYDGPNIAFYGTRKYWPLILTVVAIWKGLGYNSIIYFSSIIAIDKSLYESAYIDGCSKLMQIKYITLPLLRPTVITMVIMALGHIMNSNFGLFYQIPQNSGALYPATQTLDVYIYRSIMETQNLSMGAAAAAVQSIVGFCLVLLVNYIIRKKDAENALF